LREGLGPAAVVLLAKLGADAAMSREAVANAVENFIMRCSVLVKPDQRIGLVRAVASLATCSAAHAKSGTAALAN